MNDNCLNCNDLIEIDFRDPDGNAYCSAACRRDSELYVLAEVLGAVSLSLEHIADTLGGIEKAVTK